MPKKHTSRALLLKPQNSAPISISSNASNLQNGRETRQPSVNELIQQSRRLQINPGNSVSTSSSASIHPALRAVLDLPPPATPSPLHNTRTSGPSRLRRIPGPPPPRSWLVDSVHAPVEQTIDVDIQYRRLQTRVSRLPTAIFPDLRSLQHLVLKSIASDWDWHAEYDHIYLASLPTTTKEILLSYIAIYHDDRPQTNPLRLLFGYQNEDRAEVTRLDLSNAVGTWTTIRHIERDLLSSVKDENHSILLQNDEIAESWDEDDEYTDLKTVLTVPSISPPKFKNLKHLSLALAPRTTASWSDLLKLADKLPTILSLSLAYWPQPTYTPNAASTRAKLTVAGTPGVIYGGSDVYTAFDNNWREAAGILRSLSRKLWCLKWLDLTGCGDWFGALTWKPLGEDSVGPEWNGSWRGIEHICLGVGWSPIKPEEIISIQNEEEPGSWDVEQERVKYRYRKDLETYNNVKSRASRMVQELRSIRKDQGGKWINFEFDVDNS